MTKLVTREDFFTGKALHDLQIGDSFVFPSNITSKKNIVIVSGNKGKIEEFGKIIGEQLVNIDIDLPEIQSTTVMEVGIEKLKEARKHIEGPCIIDDTGLHIDKLNGFPGALIKFFHKDLKNDGIIKLCKGSNARAVSVIGYFDGEKEYFFEGITEGIISDEPKGEGFGWDPIFVPNGSNMTYAEMLPSVKNNVCQRNKAIEKLKIHLESNK